MIFGYISIRGALVDFGDQITKIYHQGARAAQHTLEQPCGGHHTFEHRASAVRKCALPIFSGRMRNRLFENELTAGLLLFRIVDPGLRGLVWRVACSLLLPAEHDTPNPADLVPAGARPPFEAGGHG